MMDRPLEPGRDYYLEDGLLVFAEGFLRERGSCCLSGCPYRPYGLTKMPPPPREPSSAASAAP
jgi:hypothetical protein